MVVLYEDLNQIFGRGQEIGEPLDEVYGNQGRLR